MVYLKALSGGKANPLWEQSFCGPGFICPHFTEEEIELQMKPGRRKTAS